MKKLLLTSIITLFTLVTLSQTKDSIVSVPDTLNTISVKDVNIIMDYIYGKVSHEDYKKAENYFSLLLQITEPKRKIIIKKK